LINRTGLLHHYKGVGRKISGGGGGGGATERQGRKIALLSLPILYQYHVWKSRGHGPPLPTPMHHYTLMLTVLMLWWYL